MTDAPAKVKSGGGIPWYLWILIVPVTIAIICGVFLTRIPEDPAELYQKALKHADANESKELSRLVQKLEQFPDYSAEVNLLKGIEASASSRDPRALEFFAKAAEDEELAALAYRRSGSSHAKMQQYKEAIAAYEKSLASEPDNLETQLMVAQLYFGIGSLTHSMSLLDKILEADPEYRTARAMRGLQRQELQDYSGALSDYAQLLQTPGDKASASPDTIKGYLECIIELNDKEKLAIAREEFLGDVPDEDLKWNLVIACGEFDPVKEQIRTNKGQGMPSQPMDKYEAKMALLEDRIPQASNSVKQAIKTFPRDPKVFELAVEIFKKSGEQKWLAAAEANLQQLNDINAESIAAMKAVGPDTSDASSRIRAGDQQRKLGQAMKSLRWYSVAKVVDPESTPPTMDDVFGEFATITTLVPMPGSTSDSTPVSDTEKPEAAKELTVESTDKNPSGSPSEEKPPEKQPTETKASDGESDSASGNKDATPKGDSAAPETATDDAAADVKTKASDDVKDSKE